MQLVRRAKRRSWDHPPLARLFNCAIRIHRPKGSWDQLYEVAAHNRDTVWSKQIVSAAYSIHLPKLAAFRIGKTVARHNLFQILYGNLDEYS